ncbi:MAG: DUF2071 domain-containing protein [Nocardioidaceae bacterium]|nr:DUF2071 domain-containing protein [Nocardioidaceae bacterium]
MLPYDVAAPPLRGRPIMSQWWRDLSFLHWRVDPALVAPLMPPGVHPDVLDGATYVGLVPFRMVDAGVGAGPPIPFFGTFAETNVRLYSVDDEGTHGVVFRSLEATRLAVVLGARGTFGVPYTWARMSVEHRAGRLTYTTRRRVPGPRGAGGRVVLRPGAAIADPTDEQHFVTARFGLHTRWAGRTLYVPNEHEPWPLHDAELLDLEDDLVDAAGLPGLTTRPPDSVLYSPGVRTTFGLPRRVTVAGG